jgi:signal transduction histidine kinase
MSAPVESLARSFEDALRRHLATGDEGSMHEAFELGRDALGRGLGVLDTVAALARALTAIAGGECGQSPVRLPAEAVEAFVLEALSPFEMAHRGIREANLALRHVDEAREEELRRIAHDLHDSAGQTFAPVHLALSGLAGRADPDAAEELARVRALLVRCEEQLRRMAREFRPTILDDLGLRAAIIDLATTIRARTGLAIALRGEIPLRLPPRVEIAVYRAVQEAFNNAVRHARASRIEVEVVLAEGMLRCRVEDDGAGFDPATVARQRASGGLGLRGILERVTALGGRLEVRSAPGRGTRLELEIPLEAMHADTSPDRR